MPVDFLLLEIRVRPQLLISFHHVNFAISDARIPRPVGRLLLAAYVNNVPSIEECVPTNEIKRLLIVLESFRLLGRVASEGGADQLSRLA